MTKIKNTRSTYSWVGEQFKNNQIQEPVANMFLRGLEYHPENNKEEPIIVDPFEGWTETAKELWSDISFLVGRIGQQRAYCHEIGVKYRKGHIDLERKIDLMCSAIYLQKVYALRLKELGYENKEINKVGLSASAH